MASRKTSCFVNCVVVTNREVLGTVECWEPCSVGNRVVLGSVLCWGLCSVGNRAVNSWELCSEFLGIVQCWEVCTVGLNGELQDSTFCLLHCSREPRCSRKLRLYSELR